MKILHIITRLMQGGAQENTLLCCEDLMHRHGDDVLLVTGPPGLHEGDLLPRARAGGVPLEIVPEMQRQIRPLADAIAYRKLKRIIRDFGPDVVHTHSAKAGILGRMAGTALRVSAVVHTVHGAPFHPYQSAAARGVFQLCERWAAPRCHAIISVADAMTDLMVDAGVAPREKFTTIYSGMEVEPLLASSTLRESTRAHFGYEPQHIVVGKIARLFHLKGHEYIIEAARQIVRQEPNVRFLFVGSGILRETLEGQIAAAGLTEYFQFAGLVPREEIPAMISAMDIVVHTSLREGLARVLPQALIAGKPVVSYDVDGAREVVVNDETGYLIPPKSIDELAAAVARLAADAELRDRLGREGRRRCREVFGHQYMSEEIRKLYVELLSKNQSAGQGGGTMNKAFVREPDLTDDYCPRCGSKGEPVGSETLESYLSVEQMQMVSKPVNFCPSRQCQVVYFDAFERAISTEDINRPVYPKDPTAPICPCLGLTEEDIERDVQEGVKTRVKAAIAKANSADACCLKMTANGRPCITYVQRHYLRCLEDKK